MHASLPNLITLARLLSAPVGIWLLMSANYSYAFWLFLAAGISDAVDGFLAKRFFAESELGAYLDAIADKVLLVGVFVTIGLQGHLPQWLVILVVFRDLLIVGGYLMVWLIVGQMRVAPKWSSKLTTATQIALAATVLAGLGFELDLGRLVELLVWATAAATVWSGGSYIAVGLRAVNGAPDSEIG